MQVAERRAALILGLLAAVEGTVVLLSAWPSPVRLVQYLGFAPGRAGGAGGWLAAALVTALFVGWSLRLPAVRETLFKISGLKLLALLVAIAAGILEEAVFRRMLMDALERHGYPPLAQVLASALAFGLAHGIWGLFGRSLRAAVGATLATGALGLALALVYLAAGRSLAPCVAAHLAIDLLIEPGIMLAAVRGELGRGRLAAARTGLTS